MATPSVSRDPKLSVAQQGLLWNLLVAAETRCRYFSVLAELYSSRQRKITIATVILSGSAVASILADPHIQNLFWIKLLLVGVTTILNGISLVEQYVKRAFDCSELNFKWSKLQLDYQDLWMNNMYEEDASRKLRQLQDRELEISKNTSQSVPTHLRLLNKCEDEAEAYLDSLFRGKTN